MGGELPEGGATRVLLDLSACQVTGMWEIYAGERVYRLALRNGTPIHAFPGKIKWKLGEVLVYLEAPIRGGYDDMMRTIALNPGRSGITLAEQGIVPAKYIEWALKEQISLRAAEFLPLEQGRYRLWSGPQFLKNVPRQPGRWRADELISSIRRPLPAEDHLRRLLGQLTAERDPKKALGVPVDATSDDVRSAFLAIVKSHHPDHVPPSTKSTVKNLHRLVFEAAVEAYEQTKSAA
jgi:hypothetical protein